MLGARGWISKWKQGLKQRTVAKAAARPPFRRKFLIEALEPRVLLSADLPVVPPPPPDPIPHEPPEVTAAHATAGDHVPFHFDATDLASELAGALVDPTPAPSTPLEIAFVDSRVVGQEPLTMQRDGMMVVVLDAHSDGLEQISKVLSQYEGVHAVHILAHGEEGRMFLGNTVLDADAIEQGKVADWGKALTEDGDLLLYGCDVAAGELGIEFMQRLAGATGADVAASENATGPEWLGADWTLEASTGAIEATPVIFADLSLVLASFSGTAGADSFAGEDTAADVFSFESSQLGASDTLDGNGGGTDELRITTAANLIDSAFTNVSEIEQLTLGDFDNSLTLGTQAAEWAASTSVTIDASAQTGTNGLNVSFAALANYNLIGGSGGEDVLDFSSLGTALTFQIGAGLVTITGGGKTITASGFERIIGGAGSNTFKIGADGSFAGSIEANGSGTNTLDYSGYATGATIDLAGETATGITGSITEITHVIGSNQADTITGGGAGESYQGGAGNDVYQFGDDWGDADITDASGSNTLSFSTADSGVTIQFTGASTLQVTEGGSASNPTNRLDVSGTFVEVEGSGGDDVFTAKANVTVNADLLGGDGDDHFKPEYGSTFAGDIDGGDGDDYLDYSAQAGNVTPGDNFTGELNNIDKIQHPGTIPDGIEEIAQSIQNGIDATIGSLELPLLGNIGDALTGFVDTITVPVIEGLREVLVAEFGDDRTTGELIEDWLTVVLKADFTTEIPGATQGTFGLVAIDGNHMEFALEIAGVIFEDEWALDFEGALPGLGLEIDALLELSITYDVRIAFGIDYTTLTSPKFYFDTNGEDDDDEEDDEEIELNLEATIANGDITDPQLTAILGFLQFEMTSYDNSSQVQMEGGASPYRDANKSGFFGSFAIDLQDPGEDPENFEWATNDGRLTQTEFRNAEFELADALVVKLSAYADIDLFARLSADIVDAGLPSIQFYLHYDQTFAEAEVAFNGSGGDQATFGGAPVIVIEDLALDLGTLISEFLQPILGEIQTFTEPLQPIVDLLKSDIPILSDIDLLKGILNKDGQGGVDVLDFMGTVLGNTKYASVVKAVNAIVELIDLVNSIPDEGTILIPMGTYTFGGDVRAAGSKLEVPTATQKEQDIRNKINAKPGVTDAAKGFLDKLKRDPVQGGFSLGILDPGEVLKLITGKTANLFFYDLPELNFDFNFRKSTPIVFPLNMILDAGFSVTVRMGFGYDTRGLEEMIGDIRAGSTPDFTDIFKGFFIDDHGVEDTAGDLDEVEIHSHFAVGASVGVSGIIEAGVQGGVIGTIGFDLNDVDAGLGYDGKIYFDELDDLFTRQGPLGWLDMHGALDWFLEAFVWVGLDLGFFGKITLYDEYFDLGGGNIVTFENNYTVSIPPNVAHVSGGDLVLHMGSAADQRDDGSGHSGYADLDGDADEAFSVLLSEDGLNYIVSYRGTEQSFAKSSVTRIVVSDAQGGKDTLTVGEGVTANLLFNGGDGNDKVTYLGSGTATLNGGAGDDRLVVTNGRAILTGGDGNDQLTGWDLNDSIDGGDGNDKIKGGKGDDTLRGGDESVAMTNGKANGDQIDGGDGNDLIFGGSAAASSNSGADIIKGGRGNDTIHGGNEDGTVALTSGKLLGDAIDGGDGDDVINGDAGADVIKGGKGVDIIAGGAGDDAITGGQDADEIRGGDGNDYISWTVGDAVDSVIDGGAGNDAFAVTGANTNTAITMSEASGKVRLQWGADDMSLSTVEKYVLNAGTGADTFVINDLDNTSASEISIATGGTITDAVIYDYNKDGTYGDNPPILLDGAGEAITDSAGNTLFADVYADGTAVPYKVLRTLNYDGATDSVTIHSGSGADRYTGETRSDPATPTATVLNLSRSGTHSLSFSIAQSDSSRDTFLLTTEGGDDSIDLSGVRTKVFSTVTLESGDGNDIVFGTQFADTINSGLGNDKVAGNAGVDTFIDAGGIDVLSETNHGSPTNVYDPVTGAVTAASNSTSHFDLTNANFTLDGNFLTIEHAATEQENVSVFEDVSLVAGGGANTFTVQNWMKNARLDGGAGSDTYNIHFAGSGSGSVTENDSIHVAGDVDRMFLYGTSAADIFNFTALNDPDSSRPDINPDLILTDGSVSVSHTGTAETVNYTHTERLEVRAGAGDDAITVDDNALSLYVYGEAGNDSFLIGRVTDTTIDPGTGATIATSITNGISFESFFYGDFGEDASGNEINVAQSGNDSFEVNHNKAPIWLYGNAGDDRFTVNAVLIPDPSATSGSANDSNVSGGSGSNTITYLQNAPVNIDGGSGNDVVVVNGTGIGDTFIIAVVMEDDDPTAGVHLVAKQKVIGAGVQVNMKNVERLEVNGAGGDDRIHVFSTLPDLEVIVSGGSGDDTIHIGGQAVAIVVDPPAYTIDPPAYVYDAPPYIERWESFTWTWGDFWYLDWSAFPFFFYQPLISYTWWYPVWADPAPVTIDPPPQVMDPPAFQFSAGPSTELTGIQGKLTIDAGAQDASGGLNDNDRIVVHNQTGLASDTGTLTSGDHDNDALSADVGYLSGLGMTNNGASGGFYYIGAENLDLYLNDGAGDTFTIEYTDADAVTTVFAGGGDDVIRVKAASGVLQLDGGAGDDDFQIWDDASTVSGISGTLRVNGGDGSDDVEVRDTSDTSGDTGTLTASSLSGLDMAGTIEYGSFTTQTFTYSYLNQTVNGAPPPTVLTSNNSQSFTLAYGPIENLVIGLGSGDDVLDVLGTQANTTINTNDGNDTVNVSSDGAALRGHLDDIDGTLALHLGAGNNTLNVSDFAALLANAGATVTDASILGFAPAAISYDAVGGRFTGGVNLWSGKGSDSITIASTVAGDVTTLDANDGNDSVTVSAGQAADLVVVLGGAGADALDASATTTHPTILIGDRGEVLYGATTLSFANVTEVRSTADASGGNDTLSGGTGRLFAVGGEGADRIVSLSTNDDVLVGDNGELLFGASTIVTRARSLHPAGALGGGDYLDASTGNNILIGGLAGDTLLGGNGDDVVIGDNGDVIFDLAGHIDSAASTEIGEGAGDAIDVGDGNNVVLGGRGGDTITLGTGNDVAIGDNGSLDYTITAGVSVLTRAETSDDESVLAGTGGDDVIVTGAGANVVLGGLGADRINDGALASASADVVLGDNGYATWTAAGVITAAGSTQAGQGGDDVIFVGDGDNVVLGGAGSDRIGAGGGIDALIGDEGEAVWTAGIVTQFRSTSTFGGDDDIAAGDGRNYIVGGAGGDTVTGAAGDDLVLGDNGEALFDAAGVITSFQTTDETVGGADEIDAGEGSNILAGGFGGDLLAAGAAADLIIGDNGRFAFTAGVLREAATTDTTAATGGADTIAGGNGANVVLGGAGSDQVTTGTGNDVVLGDNGQALFDAAGVLTSFETAEPAVGGADNIQAGEGRNVVAGGFGADVLATGAGDDLIIGDNGRFTFVGGILREAVTTDVANATGGGDTITAGNGNNVVLGGVGSDRVTTGTGNDIVIGDNGIAQFDAAGARDFFETRDPDLAGNDTISSGTGDDLVLGGTGSDSIVGGDGNDILVGDQGKADYVGGALAEVFAEPLVGQADFIDGGAGADILLGGGGTDTIAANLFDDVFTGESARILFANGLVTSIELFGEPDLVLQTLFNLYTDVGTDGGDVLLEEAERRPGQDGERFVVLEGGEDSAANGHGVALPPHALVFSFLRGQHMAQLPQELRNMILELYLGDGHPHPTHGGEGIRQPEPGTGPGQGQGQGQGQPPVGPNSATQGFEVEAEASTVPAQPQEASEESPGELLAAAVLGAAMATATPERTVRTFDPATGRFTERRVQSTVDRAAFEPRQLGTTGIDW